MKRKMFLIATLIVLFLDYPCFAGRVEVGEEGPGGGGSVPPAPHWSSGEHPRILFTLQEIPALRQKVTTPGTVSQQIWTSVKGGSKNPPALSFFTTVNAGIIHRLDDTGISPGYGRRVVNALINDLINPYEPPYIGDFSPGEQSRLIALIYDLCYDIMTPEERKLFQEEMLKAASILSFDRCIPKLPGNHGVVAASGLGLIALALQSDIAETARTYADVPVVRSAGTYDNLPHRSSTAIIRIGDAPGANNYTAGVDFEFIRISGQGYCIHWIGRTPSLGSTYYVTYEFTPKIQDWKRQAQLLIQRNLDSLFSDGSYQGGILYGSFTTRWMLDLIEGFKRDSGINFGRHTNFKNILKWFPYELRIGSSTDYNNLNDSHYTSIAQYKFDSYMTWLRGEYKNDPEYLDILSLWYDERETNDEHENQARDEHDDVRKALWENDDLYIGNTPIDIPTEVINGILPASKHFKGRGLVYLRSGRWDLLGRRSSDYDYALSFYAGPISRSEHMNTDQGSFTLTAMNRPFAIDNGYAMGVSERDSTAAHNYILIDGLGQPGAWGSSSKEVESAFGNFADFLYADLKESFIDTWPEDRGQTRYFDYAERFLVSIKGSGLNVPNYFAVIDEIQKQGALPGNFSWLLHTTQNMPISIGTQKVTLGGEMFFGNLQPQMDILVISPENATINTDTWMGGGDEAIHPRLKINKDSVTDPRYFILMIPYHANDTPAPVLNSLSATGGAAGEVDFTEAVDTLIYRYKGSPTASAQNIISDAKFTVIRRNPSGGLIGYLFARGKNLTVGGNSFVEAKGDGDALVTVSYQNGRVDISSQRAWLARIFAPAATSVFIDGSAINFIQDGDYIIVNSESYLEDLPGLNQPLFAENFDDNAADYFFHTNFNAGTAVYGKSTVNNGAFELFGDDGLISYTHRQVNWSNPDATIIQHPLTRFEDVSVSGKFQFQPDATIPGALYLGFRTQDTMFNYMDISQQRYYRIAIEPQNSQVRLEKVDNATVQTLSTRYAAISHNWYTYNIGIRDRTIVFTLNEVVGGIENPVLVIEHEEASGLDPQKGYLQWTATGGLHVFLDDLSVMPLLPSWPLEIANAEIRNITVNSAKVSWFTNNAASSQVLYGLNSKYGFSTPLDKNLVTDHIVTLTGLNPNTEYHLSVRSVDAQGNLASSPDMVFRTKGSIKLRKLSISSFLKQEKVETYK